MFELPRQSRDSCTTRLFLLAHAQTKVPSVPDKSEHSEVQSPSIIAGASLCFKGGPPTDLKNMVASQGWKGQSINKKNM